MIEERSSASPERLVRPPSRPRVWAVGGGKGGVGKSVVAANLGAALALEGRSVVLVDVDLGGANLHTILGVPNTRDGLSSFLSGQLPLLRDAVAPTSIGGLSLISGAHARPDIASPKSTQRDKLIRHVTALPVDHVVLDLGAGSSLNVVDFFLAADTMLVVLAPETIAVENAYHFIKAVYYRRLRRVEPRDRVLSALEQVTARRTGRAMSSPRELLAEVERLDPVAGEALRRQAAELHLAVVVNRVERSDQERLGEDMSAACRQYFGCAVTCPGHLPQDRLVPRSVEVRRPVLDAFPDSMFARSLRAIVARLVGPGPEARP